MTFHREKVLLICGNLREFQQTNFPAISCFSQPTISRFSQPAISRFSSQFPAFILTTFPQFPATIPTKFPQIPTNKSGIFEVAPFSCGTSHIMFSNQYYFRSLLLRKSIIYCKIKKKMEKIKYQVIFDILRFQIL